MGRSFAGFSAAIFFALSAGASSATICAMPCQSEARAHGVAYIEMTAVFGRSYSDLHPVTENPDKYVAMIAAADRAQDSDGETCGSWQLSYSLSQTTLHGLAGALSGSMMGANFVDDRAEEFRGFLRETDARYLHTAAAWAQCLKRNPQATRAVRLIEYTAQFDTKIEADILEHLDVDIDLSIGGDQ